MACSAVLYMNYLLPLLLLRLGRVGVVCCCTCCCVGGWVTFEAETTSGESWACCDTPRAVMALLLLCDVKKLAMRAVVKRYQDGWREQREPMKYTQVFCGGGDLIRKTPRASPRTSQLGYSGCDTVVVSADNCLHSV